MPHNENSRVKIPALVHFTRLGYKYISLRKYEGVIDDDTNILVDVLCDAINRINATSLTTTDVQKIVNSLGPKGKAAVVVPTGFLTAGSGIQKKIREHLVKERMLRGVISNPSARKVERN